MGGGIIALIHPPNWRGYGLTNTSSLKKLRTTLRGLNIHWLSMHDLDDGNRYFSAGTKFDMYVAENRKTKGLKTRIIDEKRQEYERDIKGMDFIPNFDFDEVYKLIARKGDEKIELMYDRSLYPPEKPYMSNNRSAEFRYPCVWSISRKTGDLKFRYSSQQKGHFGVPKVIFSTWHDPGIPYVDLRGKYGLTQMAAAIVDEPANLRPLATALNSERFREVMKSIQFTTHSWNYNIMRLFRKEFWKEFV